MRVGAPSFDSQNVDFASWLSQFEVKAGVHWSVPKAPNPKLPCHVDLEFVVEHDGKVSDAKTVNSSGAVDFDKSAVKALRAARFPPLPVGFQPPSVTMHVTFWFNEGEPPPPAKP
jgi:TonB family protein